MFTDEENKYIFATRDYGETFTRTRVDFKPEVVSFHKSDYKKILAMDKGVAGTGQVFISSTLKLLLLAQFSGQCSFVCQGVILGSLPCPSVVLHPQLVCKHSAWQPQF